MILADVGHMMMLESPREFGTCLKALLDASSVSLSAVSRIRCHGGRVPLSWNA